MTAKKLHITKPDKEFIPGKGFTKADWDAVDSPEATDEQIAQARPFTEVFPDLAENIRRSRGRPALDNPKKQVTLRLDSDVIARFRAGGPGWQSRINDILRKAAGLQK
ncbi:BrnA antitoxin family protein [Mesorhizobium sp. B1-1-5]|uniref:BrnA antitoxin family protein n=1 Tax=Mesorhizobium sp. B1-1-5 TaxID=2589979 RepID=UPI00112E66DC|nr:BrnA antitoxin family protein [Mesorhizobium sp. B1-1-5]TPN92808.1 BrnA antitoxin family protein [Mesorhizobium sp. B1-1-5]